MESQMPRPQAPTYNTASGEDEHHHEKKSVLTKVKDKAKKMKKSLTPNKGHGHEQGDDHDQYDEDDDNDEEMVEDPKVQGAHAPISDHGQPRVEKPTSMEEDRYAGKTTESPTKPFGGFGGQVPEDRTHGQQRVNSEKPTSMEEDRYAGKTTESPTKPFGGFGGQVPEDRTHEKPRDKIEKPTSMEEDRYEGKTTESPTKSFGAYGGQVPEDRTHGQPREKPTSMEEDRNAGKTTTESPTQPLGAYGGQVPKDRTDHGGRGGEEAGMASIVGSMDKMKVCDEPEPKTRSGPEQISQNTETHDQFSPENPQSVPKSSDSGKPEDMPHDTVTGNPSKQSYTEMITSATSAITGTAFSAKNVVASKLGYGSKEGTQEKHEERPRDTLNTREKHEEGPQDTSKPSPVGGYGNKIAAAKNVVASKLGYGGKEGTQEKHEERPRDTLNTPEKHEEGPQDTSKPSPVGGYGNKIAAAKNVVASKLGYGGKEGTQEKHEERPRDTLNTPEKHEEGPQDTSKPSPVGGYGNKIAATVYGAGSAVMSKVQGTGAEQGKKESGTTKGPDKGASVKEYLAEKFRPSEEDKALSDVISDKIHKREEKSEGESKPVGKVEEKSEGESKPVEKVTESEEVKRRLGTSEKDSRSGEGPEEAVISGETTPGKGVVDKLKGAVGSWLPFGKPDGSRNSQTSLGASHDANHGDGVRGQEAPVGEPRLPESSN